MFGVQAVPTVVALAAGRPLSSFEGMQPMDVSFYFRLYSTIGGVSGFFAWHVATLVARNRIRARSVVHIMAIPLAFIVVLAADKNPITAIVVILLFALGSLPTYIVVRRNKAKAVRLK